MTSKKPCSEECIEKQNSEKCFPKEYSKWWINNTSMINSEYDGSVYKLLYTVDINGGKRAVLL